MISSPLLSIVVPSFNQARFLEACLDSVLDQSFPHKEILVFDGGSTDGSVELLHKYSRHLTFWESEKDRGQAHAVNKGWTRAKGEVLGWLNSDDRYRPEALGKVAEAYAQHPQVAMIYGDVVEIDAAGAVGGKKSMAGFGLRSLLLGKNMGQPGVFITRKAYTALGGLDEELHYALDFDYFLRVWSAFPAEDFFYIPRVLAESRRWESTKSLAQGDRFGEEYRRTLDRFFARTDLPADVRAWRRRAYGRSVFLRQARLCFDAGDGRNGSRWLMQAIWAEKSPLEVLRMIRMAIATWNGRNKHAE